MADERLAEALRHLQPHAGTQLWHGGATVLGALRGVNAEVAAWKPFPDGHNIWELALHIAYWKYAVRRRLTDEPRGGFPRKPSNWPDVPVPATSKSWNEDRKVFKDCHFRLVDAMQNFDSTRLDEIAGGEGKTTFADLITGIVLHDVYHTGQIQILKRFAASSGV